MGIECPFLISDDNKLKPGMLFKFSYRAAMYQCVLSHPILCREQMSSFGLFNAKCIL